MSAVPTRVLEVLPDREAVARRAADVVAEAALEAIGVRGRFTFAVSGGRSPWAMFAELADEEHTASLVPGDPVLEVTDRDVALTGEYRGLRRMTFSYRVLDRSRQVLWLIAGDDKAPLVPRLLAGDRSIPAGRVGTAEQLVVVDAAAAAEVAPS
jgi:6-phosphogluconolactonase/glucosamine-6-phosphate isomerase/deaminase